MAAGIRHHTIVRLSLDEAVYTYTSCASSTTHTKNGGLAPTPTSAFPNGGASLFLATLILICATTKKGNTEQGINATKKNHTSNREPERTGVPPPHFLPNSGPNKLQWHGNKTQDQAVEVLLLNRRHESKCPAIATGCSQGQQSNDIYKQKLTHYCTTP